MSSVSSGLPRLACESSRLQIDHKQFSSIFISLQLNRIKTQIHIASGNIRTSLKFYICILFQTIVAVQSSPTKKLLDWYYNGGSIICGVIVN